MNAQKKKVLIVDDEGEFLSIISKFLYRRGVGFRVADCCLQALERLDEDDFDVIVMDVKMPGLNGLECMQQMKKIYPALEGHSPHRPRVHRRSV